MEKSYKPMNKFFSFLPKSARVSFSNPPFSPGRDRKENHCKFKPNQGKGFSGPIISIIPVEARRSSRNGSFHSQEPTSPKVSCIGQVKHKNRICKTKSSKSAALPKQEKDSKPANSKPKLKSKPSLMKIFGGSRAGKKSKAKVDKEDDHPVRAPALSQMKRFSSGRDAFVNFDWKDGVGIVPATDHHHRNYYSDDEREDLEEEFDDEDDFAVPHSAPLVLGSGGPLGPRKDVNIWRRRTLAQPKPLVLNAKII